MIHAFEIFGRGSAVAGAARAGRAFAAVPTIATAFAAADGLIGVIGTDRIVAALVRFGLKLGSRAGQADREAGEEMVERMRADVPQDTGRLLNGITLEIGEDGSIVVTASAVNPRGQGGLADDYARYIEFGTEKMAAEPFFMEAAREALEGRGLTLEQAIASAASEEGF